MSNSMRASLLLALVVGGLQAAADLAPDNSKVNAAVEHNGALTAQDQGSSSSDIEMTRKIRQAVVAKDSFSMNAKNIKIITVNGVVTLKGPVKNATERNEIQKIANHLAGGAKVVNQISVE